MRKIWWGLLLALGLWGGQAGPSLAQEAGAGKTMIIMDASGSMWGKIGKQPKLQIAKRAVNQFLKRLPDDYEVGLMAYGHRREGDCKDIQVLVRPDLATDRKINRALGKLDFLGKTPIAESLRQAAKALKSEDQKATIILVTDGTESCKGNPCALASRLEEKGLDLTIHVIGFGLEPAEGRQLTCIPNRTGGKYFAARNARQLAAALDAAMQDDPVLTDGEGAVLAEGYYRGAPVMLNTVLNVVGNIGIVAQSPQQSSFPADGTIGDCQAQCEGDPLCAAWRYDPKGATAAGTAICTMHDYAAALDYADVDPTAGYASGMKVAAVQLIRPYVPAPVVADADATAASAPVWVTIRPANGPEGLDVAWQVIPLNDPEGASVAAELQAVGEWQVELAPGEYALEGLAEGWLYEGYIRVAADQAEFQIEGTALGDAQAEPVEDMAEVNDVEEIDDAQNQPSVAAGTSAVEAAPDVAEPPVTIVATDPALTLALAGEGAVSDAGYRCDDVSACGFQDQTSGLVFALPSGWGSDKPVAAQTAEGGASDLWAMTFFGPEGEDGSLPTLLLNPLGWMPANGQCVTTAAGELCAWGDLTAVMQDGLDQIAPSLVMAGGDIEVDALVDAESAEPESMDATELPEAPLAVGGGTVPQDGNWSGSADPVTVTQCPAGFDKALDLPLAMLTASRPLVWQGQFDPAVLALDPIEWSVTDTIALGQSNPIPLEGLPEFILSTTQINAELVDPDHITGDIAMTFYADGPGTISLLNAGLQSCRLTTTFALTRDN